MNNPVEVVKNLPREPRLYIWRIENMELASIPEKTYGQFYEGDCYILLNLRRSGSSSSYDLHYWIGEHSSQDEQGTAAFLTAQLDVQMGGVAIQHREYQEHESSSFRSYFKNRLMYKKGGVASGFRHVETNTHNVQRLLHIKGRKNCTAREVSMDWSSFNNGDCFLLDLGKMIIQYNGAESHYKERMKAVRMASDIRDRERGGRAQLGIIDGDQESSSPELMGVLHSVLGQRKGNLPPATPDNTPDRETMANLKLYLVSDTEGKLMVEEMATRPLTQDLLNSKDCYILDQCGIKISVWKGKHSSQEEKQAAMKQALGFIKAKGYPQTTNVETMVDGAESAMFKHLFTDWKDRNQTEGFGKTHSINRVAKVEQVKFDVAILHAQPQLAAEQRMVDDGSGTVEVFRVEDLELAEVPKKQFGQFYGGDCYLVLYTYTVNYRQAYIIYMWQGLKATKDEVTASAYQAVDLDNKVNGQAVQVRVVMGKEPKHFLAIFKGKLVIYQGGTSRVGGNSEEPPVRLFQVRGSNETNTKAIEVPARSTSLNSNDVFVLKRKMDTHCFLWCGKGCSGDEREMARTVADLISHQEKTMELEGNESSEFWGALGGKAPYSSDKRLQEKNLDVEPRLFECSTQTGRFYVTEICNFTQEDLDEEDVMLLDTWDQVFLWLGSGASKAERDESLNIAKEYIHTHPANHNTDKPIIVVKQGFEPLTFTGWFMAWDPHKWSSGKTYEELRSEYGDEAAVRNISSEMTNTSMSNIGHPGSSTSSTRGGMSSDRTDSMYGNKDNSYGSRDGSYGNKDGSYGSRHDSHGNRDYSYGNRDDSHGNRDDSYGNRDDSYGSRDDSYGNRNSTSAAYPPQSPTFNGSYTTYPAAMLTNKTSEELPEDVDPTIKEKYLSEDEFNEIMEMPRYAFEQLPVWRQKNLKKAKGLF